MVYITSLHFILTFSQLHAQTYRSMFEIRINRIRAEALLVRYQRGMPSSTYPPKDVSFGVLQLIIDILYFCPRLCHAFSSSRILASKAPLHRRNVRKAYLHAR